MSIITKACVLRRTRPGPVYVSTFLKTWRTGEFVPLLIDVDLRQQLGAKALSKVLPPCAS